MLNNHKLYIFWSLFGCVGQISFIYNVLFSKKVVILQSEKD